MNVEIKDPVVVTVQFRSGVARDFIGMPVEQAQDLIAAVAGQEGALERLLAHGNGNAAYRIDQIDFVAMHDKSDYDDYLAFRQQQIDKAKPE